MSLENKIVNPKLVATHHFCEVGIFTKEFESQGNENACVHINGRGMNKTIFIKAVIENGKIVTSISLI